MVCSRRMSSSGEPLFLYFVLWCRQNVPLAVPSINRVYYDTGQLEVCCCCVLVRLLVVNLLVTRAIRRSFYFFHKYWLSFSCTRAVHGREAMQPYVSRATNPAMMWIFVVVRWCLVVVTFFFSSRRPAGRGGIAGLRWSSFRRENGALFRGTPCSPTAPAKTATLPPERWLCECWFR